MNNKSRKDKKIKNIIIEVPFRDDMDKLTKDTTLAIVKVVMK